jgi:branched-chain amino acid transport system ATP-binding protein
MLDLTDVRVDRGGFPVVRGVDLHAPKGAVTVLLGPNGAGKSTLLEAISGVIPIGGGHMTLDERDVTKAGRRTRAVAGLAHVEQGRTIFADLTVRENLLAVGDDDAVARAVTLFPELEKRLDVRSALCSGGEQQMVVIARALATSPKLLMIDELSLGLAPVVVGRLMRVVRDLADDGIGVLLVEQYAFQALAIGDNAYVLNRGTIAFSGAARELHDNPDRLREAYLHGGAGGDEEPANAAASVEGDGTT